MRSALQKFEPTLRHHQKPRSAASLWNIYALVSMEGVIFEELSFSRSYTEVCIKVVSRPECFG